MAVPLITIALLVIFHGYLGWNGKIRQGLISAVALSLLAAVAATCFVKVPSEVGGIWIFAISFLTLAAISCGSLGMLRGFRLIIRP